MFDYDMYDTTYANYVSALSASRGNILLAAIRNRMSPFKLLSVLIQTHRSPRFS